MQVEDLPSFDLVTLKRTEKDKDKDDDDDEDTPMDQLINKKESGVTLLGVVFENSRWNQQRALAYLNNKGLDVFAIRPFDGFRTLYVIFDFDQAIPATMVPAEDAAFVWFLFVLTDDL